MNQLSDYDFEVPKELIALQPLKSRSSCRLLTVNNHGVYHEEFNNILNHLHKGDTLVINNTKVIKARLFAYKETGGMSEVFLVKKIYNNKWSVLIKGLNKHTKLFFDLNNKENFIEVVNKSPDQTYEVSSNICLEEYAQKNGLMPLPPYIDRDINKEDENDYQTIFAQDNKLGAVAAPTAGLHFDEELLQKIKDKGVNIAQVTLHVGLGTFFPIRTENIDEHKMHKEFFIMTQECANILNITRKNNHKIIAVGTTSLRVLEQIITWSKERAYAEAFFACEDSTDIFIKPPHKFLSADALITNFHLPKSTLFLLVSAIMGKDKALSVYKEAIKQQYRFFSYGDACYLDIHRE
jgi:S-adenosylmethionine:tRNA ribosyltransferase-isomerase